ncbi:histidine phosphatase family protein [Piscinibacter sakaiensis]|uniref:histidine phosphatase family protein n=1 Tax=Piscinibacter sakaiensis TaxID=1547922 RepID=UPI003729E910
MSFEARCTRSSPRSSARSSPRSPFRSRRTGDPPQFRLGDCSTQRNLSEGGRDQARRLGAAFRARGIAVGELRSSQWCRTRDTAELAFPGRLREDADFNSFFGRGDSAQEQAQTQAARATLARWRGPGVLVVVTHQVNITALTGIYPASGEGVVLQPGADGALAVVGRVRPRRRRRSRPRPRGPPATAARGNSWSPRSTTRT